MTKQMSLMIALLLTVVLSVAAYAQPGGRGGPGGPGGFGGPGGPGGFGGGSPEMQSAMMTGMMVRQALENETVKSRLQLTESQTKELQKIADDARAARGGGRGPGGGGPGGPGGRPSQEDMAKMQAEMTQRAADVEKKINNVLTPEQKIVAKELKFQISGGLESRGLNADMLDTVGLSEEQKSQINAVVKQREEEGRAAMEQLRQQPVNIRDMSDEDRRTFFEKMRSEDEARNKKYSEKIQSFLSPEQLAKAKALTESGQSLRPSFGGRGGDSGGRGRGPDGPGGPGGPGGDGYRPGGDSWQPGQGGGQRQNQPRRAFPKSEEE